MNSMREASLKEKFYRDVEQIATDLITAYALRFKRYTILYCHHDLREIPFHKRSIEIKVSADEVMA